MFSKVILLVVLAFVASVAAQSTGKCTLIVNYIICKCCVCDHQSGKLWTDIKQ